MTADTRPVRRPIRRPNMRRAVILFPSGLTLGNLFFGIFAIIAASRLEFTTAGVYVLLGGLCDALDGRVARATNAGTEFGEELDSLVDAITFGLAPGMIMYFAVLNRDGWDWIWMFFFAACAVMRLARFNIEQAGTAKEYFQGLPSPAAGITLASYYWFSQSPLYTYGAIGDLPWHALLRIIMAVLSFLMISNIPYPTLPRTGFRSLRSIGATLVLIGAAVLLATRRLEYFFPCALIYVAWGVVRWVFGGLFERRQPTIPYDLSEGEDEEEEEEFELTDSRVHARRQGHRDRHSVSVPVVVAERPLRDNADRAARRDKQERKQKDRPKRPERSDRPERPERPDRSARAERSQRPERPEHAERAATTAAATRAAATSAPPAAPPPSGVGAITLASPTESAPGVDAESPYLADDTTSADASIVGGATESDGAAPGEGATPRRRKRRRRRGRDRGTTESAAPAEASSSPGGDAASSETHASTPAVEPTPAPSSAEPITEPDE